MPNICMDTVIFYVENDSELPMLQQLNEALESCYPPGEYSGSAMAKLLHFLDIPTDGLYYRGDIIHYSLEDDTIQLDCDSAWEPMQSAYEALARHFGLKMVFSAEEIGCNLYYNSDEEGLYLDVRYKVYLSEKPTDGSLDELFLSANGDTDFYFSDESEVLQWFQEKGNIHASTLQNLREQLDPDYIMIHEYTNP